jgi:DNA-binding NarL/FixJ family response regulator
MIMSIRIAIADDHPLVISGLRYALANSADMEITGSYINGTELLKGLADRQPDVLLLDIHMPGQTGDNLIDIICEKYPAVKILVLTNLDNVYYVKTMMRKGAKGYALKTTIEPLLLDAIRKVNAGEQYLDNAIKEKLLQDTLRSRRDNIGQPVLSTREKEVLQYIALDMTSQEIADKLFLSKRTVESHRLSLFTKLGVKNMAGLVKKGIQMGLID